MRRLALAAVAGALIAAAPALAQTVSTILEPAALVEIRTSVPGRLARIDVEEGQTVQRGDDLASIDARVQQARVALSSVMAAARAQQTRAALLVDQAQAVLDRVKRAHAKGAAKNWEVAQAELGLALAQADAATAEDDIARLQAQLDLEKATLAEFSMTAPFDGTVLRIVAHPGEIVTTDATILELADLSQLKATAFLPEDWARGLTKGDTIPGRLGAPDGPMVEASVASVEPRIDPASQSVRVELEFKNPDKAVFAGTPVFLVRR